MDINLSRIYTTINADELKVGDKVIVADNPATLRERVMGNIGINELSDILPDNRVYRFIIKGDSCHYALAYLIERKHNCLNCRNKCYFDRALMSKADGCNNWESETEQKSESAKYRAFRDINELINIYDEKFKETYEVERIDNRLCMPLIWVRDKHREHDECFIVRYDRANNNIHIAGFGEFSLDGLFECFEFLDGTPCGVEE